MNDIIVRHRGSEEWRNLLGLLLYLIGLAGSLFLAFYAATHENLSSSSGHLLTSVGRKGLGFEVLLNALPPMLRPIPVLYAPVFITIICTPPFLHWIWRLVNNLPAAVLNDEGITVYHRRKPVRVPWHRLTQIDLTRPSRKKMWRSAGISFFWTNDRQPRSAKLQDVLIYLLSFNWVLLRPIRIQGDLTNFKLSNAIHDFDPTEIMNFVRKRRRDLVQSIPLPVELQE